MKTKITNLHEKGDIWKWTRLVTLEKLYSRRNFPGIVFCLIKDCEPFQES